MHLFGSFSFMPTTVNASGGIIVAKDIKAFEAPWLHKDPSFEAP